MDSSLKTRATERFGHPPEARLLIINADDFGMCHAINDAILTALKSGVVSSTTLMTPCPWAPHAMRLLEENPEIAFGVHLTLVCDFASYKWRPLSSRDRVSSLVEEAGFFYSYQRIPELLERARIDELEIEFRAQIETVLSAGLVPTHLDWHCLADGGRPDVFDLTLKLAREYGLALRTHLPASVERCRSLGLPVVDHEVLDSYRLGFEDKAERYVELLRALPAGLTEWAVHPSLGDAEAQAMEPVGWEIRRADYDFFASNRAREILEGEGIIVLNYRDLQGAWKR